MIERRIRSTLMQAALLSMPALGACGSEKSPLDLWDMQAGMPQAKLDSIALHDQQERFSCMPSYGKYEQCYISTKGADGRMEVILDSTKHAASISFHPDVRVMSLFASSTGAGLLIETELLRRRWSRITPSIVDSSSPPTRIERWVTKDGKWSSRIVWSGSSYPSEISVAAEQTARRFRDLAYAAELDSMMRVAGADPLELTIGRRGQAELASVSEELTRLADAQEVYFGKSHRYAGSTADLYFMPRAQIEVEVKSGGPSGWWAIGTHERLRNQRCVIWVGVSAQPPRPEELRLGGEPRKAECGTISR